jgi:ribosomal protein S18 acetylase RimI-like enzyme
MTASRRIEHRLRSADRNDLPRLTEIASAAFGDDSSLDLSELQRDASLFLAEWRTAVDGFMVLLPLQASILIHRMAVAEEARGQGLGAWLLDCAAEHARSQELKAVEIQRPVSDRTGIDWLRRQGFTADPHGGNRIYLRRLVQQ